MRSETRRVCEADFVVVNGLILCSLSFVLTTFFGRVEIVNGRSGSRLVNPFSDVMMTSSFERLFDLLCELNTDQV